MIKKDIVASKDQHGKWKSYVPSEPSTGFVPLGLTGLLKLLTAMATIQLQQQQ